MDLIILSTLIGLSVGLLLVPKTLQANFHLVLQLGLVGLSGFWAVSVLGTGVNLHLQTPFHFLEKNVPLGLLIDRISAFFILIIDFVFLMGCMYARGYLRPYQATKTRPELGWHYFNLFWLQLALILVVSTRGGMEFLISWELMSLSSFFLALFESEKKETLTIATRYLIQMHVGMLCILIGFLICYAHPGGVFGFADLHTHFQTQPPFWIFVLFFFGFGIKSGFLPFHGWLPQAHPAAPAHVSGMMSGIMIKMGVYGILRVVLELPKDSLSIGVFVLLVSIATGLYGIMNAIVQKDTKKILAFSSIENIGIIGIGIGTSIVGKSLNINEMETLGMAGALLHILNHSLFKSLLFFNAGSIYQQTHTRYIEHLGGLIHKMPYTGATSLVASLGICGLPPFNGLISEFLIYSGLFYGLKDATLGTDLLILLTFLSLALIGGLAVFCFTRFFGVVFLGSARNACVSHAHEVEKSMLYPKILLASLVLGFGLGGGAVISLIGTLLTGAGLDALPLEKALNSIYGVSIGGGVLVILVAGIYFIRSRQQKTVLVERGLPWG
jgi:formate hydrogenlyase subunit 3/multisubunit Na+/H+ antiporter MnhD subunit